jgi:hypothetical protein
MGVEALGFDHVLADDAEPRQISVSLRMRVNTARSPGGSREEPYGAVGQDAVHVEEYNLDFFCAIDGISHWLLVLSIWYLALSSWLLNPFASVILKPIL